MKALLKIPYEKRLEAKEIAKKSACALFFDSVSKSWELRGQAVPSALMQYVVSDSITEESISRSSEDDIIINPEKNYYNYVVDMPFQMRERVTEYGGYYNSYLKTYIVKASSINEELVPYLAQPFSYEAWIEKFINKEVVRADILDKFLPLSVITARDYQKSAYTAINKAQSANLGGFLLADEVGLGKTISAGLVAQDHKNILIVTTFSAVAHWRQVFIKMGFNNTKNILIINYDRLHKLFKPVDESPAKKVTKGAKKRKISRKTKTKKLINQGLAPYFDLVVWDESHKMKNNLAQRSQMGLKIATKAFFNLYLSATAGQNPLELSYLAPLLAKITGQSVESMSDFELWCKSMNLGVKRAEFGKWVWDQSDESIEKVRSLLFDGKPPAGIRRNPSDIAGYPELSRELYPFDLSPDEIQSYMLAWNEFKHVMNGAKNTRNKKGEDNQLVAKLRLRQKSSFLKIPYTLEYIENFLEKNHQVAVSVAFKGTMFELEAKLLAQGVTCSLIYGGQNAVEKESMRMKFQTGVNKVVLFTVEEAISLHQGEYNDAIRTMLIHDLRWSAISMSQIEGRTHRDGKFSQIYWLYFTNSIEEDIAKIVLNRVISMKSMVGDDTKTLKEIEKLLLDKIQ